MDWGVRDEHALSPVVGMVVLVGIVAMGGVVVSIAAGGLIGSVQDQATNEQAAASMTTVAGELQGSGETVARFPDECDTFVDPDAGSMTVELRNETTNANETVINTSLGELYCENAGSTVAYQGGGVWRQDTAGQSTMERPPPIDYVDQEHPTLVLPVPTIEGRHGTVDDDHLRTNSSERVFPNRDSGANPVTNDTLVLEIESEYYQAWGEYLEDEFDTAIYTDPAAEMVGAELEPAELDPPDAPDSDAGLTSFAYHEGSNLQISNDVTVDSYDSTDGPYDPADAGENAHIKSENGDFSLDNDVNVKGDVDVGGPASLTTTGTIHGDTRIGASGETTTVSDSATFHGEFSTKESLGVSGDASFERDVVVAGDLVDMKSGEIHGDLYVHGDASVSGNASFEQDVVVGDDLERLNGEIDGDLYVHGDADASGDGHVYGDVIVGGSQTITESWSDITVDGAVTENATDLPDLRDPADPDLDVDEPDVNVTETIEGIEADNDNAGADDVDGRSNKLKNCPSTCELTAGDYYLDELGLSGSTTDDSLRFNTSDGPVRIAVGGDVRLDDAEIEVEYDTDDPQPVQFYVAGDYRLVQASSVEIPNDRTPVFEVFMHPTSTWRLDSGSVFRGVVYGLSDASERATVSLRGNRDSAGTSRPEFYGAVIGDIAEFDKSLGYHRDEALGYGNLSEYDPEDVGKTTPDLILEDADVAYLHVEQRTVEVD